LKGKTKSKRLKNSWQQAVSSEQEEQLAAGSKRLKTKKI